MGPKLAACASPCTRGGPPLYKGHRAPYIHPDANTVAASSGSPTRMALEGYAPLALWLQVSQAPAGPPLGGTEGGNWGGGGGARAPGR